MSHRGRLLCVLGEVVHSRVHSRGAGMAPGAGFSCIFAMPEWGEPRGQAHPRATGGINREGRQGRTVAGRKNGYHLVPWMTSPLPTCSVASALT